MPELPSNLILSNAKQVSFDDALKAKIEAFETESKKVVKLLIQITEPEQITQLVYQHNLVLSTLQNLEGEILEPLFRPLAFVDENGQTNLRAGSTMQLFTLDKNKIVFQIDEYANDKAIASTASSISTSTASALPSTTSVPSAESSNGVDDVDQVGTEFPIRITTAHKTTKGPTSTTKPTTSEDDFFNFDQSSTTTTTAVPPEISEKGWFSWFASQFSIIKTATSYITVSWKFPSIYDILLGITSLFHTVTLIVFCACCQRKTARPTVKTINFSRLFWNRSCSKKANKDDIESPSADEEGEESVPMVVQSVQPTVKSVRMLTNEVDNEVNRPKSVLKRPKRSAPEPPSAPQAEPYMLYNEPRGRGYGASNRGRVRGYLRTSIPVYLMSSDISVDQSY
jgi:hypothetical protein